MKLILKPPSPSNTNHPSLEIEYPLQIDLLQKRFEDTLPNSTAAVRYEWYPNTSDVLIVSTSFGTVDTLNHWSLRILGVDSRQVPQIRELLLSEGMDKLEDWFNTSEHLLKQDPAQWVCYSLTIRYENNELLYDAKSAWRDWPRPEPGWPQGPYRPHGT